MVNATPKCEYCNGTLVPVGSARANGKDHADWANRRLHKKCWKEVQESERSERLPERSKEAKRQTIGSILLMSI